MPQAKSLVVEFSSHSRLFDEQYISCRCFCSHHGHQKCFITLVSVYAMQSAGHIHNINNPVSKFFITLVSAYAMQSAGHIHDINNPVPKFSSKCSFYNYGSMFLIICKLFDDIYYHYYYYYHL